MKRHWICEKITFGALLSVAAGSVHGELLVYEPFDYLPDEILTGQGGALGTVGLWNTFDTITGDGKTQDWFVHAEGMTSGVGLSSANPSAEPSGMHRWDGTVANLPTSGGYAGLWGADDWNDPDGPNTGEPGRNMSGDVGLDPGVTATFQSGTTTWISYVSVRGWDRNEEHPNLVLASDPAPDGSRGDNFGGIGAGGSGFGTGGGPTRNNRTTIYPMFYDAGQYQNVNGAIPGNAYSQGAFEVAAGDRFDWLELDEEGYFGAVNIVIVKLEWDVEAGGEDVISVVRFLETDVLSEAAFEARIAEQPSLSSANWDAANKPDLDQSQFDTLTFMGLKFFVDEIRLGTTFDDVVKGGVSPEIQPQLYITSNGPDLKIQWESHAGMFYVLRSSADLAADLSTWDSVDVPGSVENDGVFEIAGTVPLNTHTILRPGDSTRFFRMEEFPLPPPPPLFEEDFESGAGDWVAVVNDASSNTLWQLGTPSGSTGPITGVDGSANAWSTNLGDYGTNSDISLFSPPLDFSGLPGAELTFKVYRDADGFGDTAFVRFRRVADDVQLGPGHDLDMAVFDTDYTSISIPVPVETIGETVRIEFNFVSDGSPDAFSGLSIDNVVVTTPVP
tara:strand:- start:1591 stop:3438 length:1848 start_codon:yes stop_codon:yes gene_type:complete